MKKLFKVYKKLTFLQGAAFAVSMTSIIGIAATISGIQTFVPGTPISSSEVNSNFNILKNAIETNSSQIYIGTYNASLAVDPPGSTPGEYYVISAAGTINTISYAVGDWIIFNGTVWEKITKSSAVTNVFGRAGSVVAAKGDYNLGQLGDVTTTTLANGQVLKFNGSNWVNATFTETDPSVSAFAKTALPTCNTGDVLKSNGTSLSCVTDNAGVGAFTGSLNRVVTTDGSGALTSSTVTSTELDYLSGVTSGIQTQISNKADLTNVTQSITAANINANNITSTMINASNITGLGPPTSPADAANKAYVDNSATWIKSGSSLYNMTENIGIGTTAPSYNLHVIGTAGGTSAYQTISDARYKKEIKTVANALEKILSINGVSYKFRNKEFPDLKFSNHRELGVIAQTVEKVFPEAITIDSNGFRSVAYTMLISPMIEAIREINSKTTRLESENKMLKSYLCERDPNAPFCEK